MVGAEVGGRLGNLGLAEKKKKERVGSVSCFLCFGGRCFESWAMCGGRNHI